MTVMGIAQGQAQHQACRLTQIDTHLCKKWSQVVQMNRRTVVNDVLASFSYILSKLPERIGFRVKLSDITPTKRKPFSR